MEIKKSLEWSKRLDGDNLELLNDHPKRHSGLDPETIQIMIGS